MFLHFREEMEVICSQVWALWPVVQDSENQGGKSAVVRALVWGLALPRWRKTVYELNFVAAFHECLLFSGSKLCNQLSTPVKMLHKNSSPWSSHHKTKSANAHPLLFQFLSERPGNPSRAQLSASDISNYRLHSLMWNDSFVSYCLLRYATILLDHFINAISVSLVGCCSRSTATLLVIQAGISEVCISDTCSPNLHNRRPINNYHSPINANRWNVFCSQNWITARCLFRTDIGSILCAIFAAVIQRSLVIELWSLTPKSRKSDRMGESFVYIATWVCF
jgi:hypothetical protein